MSPYSLGIFYAVLTGVCWAVLAIGLKYALLFASTGTIAWVRMVFAFVILLAYYTVKNPQVLRTVFLPPSRLVTIAGLFLAFNYFGYLKGIEFTSASNAQIMIQIGPVALLLFGVFYFHEPLRLIQWVGIFMALIGFVFFNWDQIIIALDQSHKYMLGNLWIIVAALAWTIFAVLQKIQLKKNWTPQMINLLIYGICVVALTPVATFAELADFSLWQWFVLFLLGLNTFVAYGSLAEAINLIPASLTSLIISINPLLTIFLMEAIAHFQLTFVSHEPIQWRGYLGAALVVTGVAVAVSLRARKPKQVNTRIAP